MGIWDIYGPGPKSFSAEYDWMNNYKQESEWNLRSNEQYVRIFPWLKLDFNGKSSEFVVDFPINQQPQFFYGISSCPYLIEKEVPFGKRLQFSNLKMAHWNSWFMLIYPLNMVMLCDVPSFFVYLPEGNWWIFGGALVSPLGSLGSLACVASHCEVGKQKGQQCSRESFMFLPFNTLMWLIFVVPEPCRSEHCSRTCKSYAMSVTLDLWMDPVSRRIRISEHRRIRIFLLALQNWATQVLVVGYLDDDFPTEFVRKKISIIHGFEGQKIALMNRQYTKWLHH